MPVTTSVLKSARFRPSKKRRKGVSQTVMKDRDGTKMLKTGLIGAAVAAVCCFTPLLVVALGAIGLSGLVGWWLDLILFPALGFFLLLTGYAFYRRGKQRVAG